MGTIPVVAKRKYPTCTVLARREHESSEADCPDAMEDVGALRGVGGAGPIGGVAGRSGHGAV
jgi:hypothetical protein